MKYCQQHWSRGTDQQHVTTQLALAGTNSGRAAEEQQDPQNWISCSSGSTVFWLLRFPGASGRSPFVKDNQLSPRGLNESGRRAAKVDESRTSCQ